MKILVTGSNGLVGNAIYDYVNNIMKPKNDTDIEHLEHLQHTWLFINRTDCNLLNFKEVYDMINSIKPDYIIHLAAEVGGLFKNIKEKVKMFENNISMNFNIIKVAHAVGVQNVMCCLSTCIFPDKVSYPINESVLHDGSPHDSNYPYAYAKRFLDIHCRIYREQHNRNYYCVIPTNIYGPNDNFNIDDGHVIPVLIHKCYLAKKNDTPFIIMGSGSAVRQFIYSRDVAKCIYNLLMYHDKIKSVIISVPEMDEISIRQLATLISDAFDYKGDIICDQTFSDGQYKKTVDNTYLMSLLGTKLQFTSVNDGIKETIKWFLDNKDSFRGNGTKVPLNPPLP